MREGYTRRGFLADLGAGATVAVIALPLAMALGIGSIPANVAEQLQAIHPWLTPPAIGLFTAVIAGLLVSALGGSRVQIGGPTAAFMPLVFTICAAHGYEGLLLATLMAGVILILLGAFGFGGVIKFVPYPVVTGFTAGIGIVILVSQVRDFLGLTLVDATGAPTTMPSEVFGKVEVLWTSIASISPYATCVGVGTLAVLIGMRRWLPRVPAAVVAVGLSALVVHFMGWSNDPPLVETIGTRFGGIPSSLPAPHLPTISWQLVRDLIPSATAIAFLGAIESLLSAVVADGMTGHRHRSNQELIAQGTANVASSLFWGLPATGAIARTAANVRSGGTTPIAGMLHALFILLFMMALAPLASTIPLASLAAVLVMVAWNVSELQHARSWLRGPRADVLALFTTLGLTVVFDLTIAVGTGILLSSILFMQRMAQISTVTGITDDLKDDGASDAADAKDARRVASSRVPAGVEVYEINGPFFFGAANNLRDALDQLEKRPKVIILRMRHVPHIDSTGLNALSEFHRRCARHGTVLLLGGVHAHPLMAMARSGLDAQIGTDHLFENLDDALARARELVRA
ncbi:MAG: STAS domain-containing protein [Phycisphaerae bacterium]|nr:STAS domain-containing protein [Phycisphaerae bacterium]